MPNNIYHSKVFYIRYREEQVNMGEIIQYDTTASDEASLIFELWFLERPNAENTTIPPSVTDVTDFRLVSTKTVKFKLKNTFEHF